MTVNLNTNQYFKKINALKNWLNQFFVLYCFSFFYMVLVSIVWIFFTPLEMSGGFTNKLRDQLFACLFLIFPFFAAANWRLFRNTNILRNRFFLLFCWSVLILVFVALSLLWNEPSSDGSFRSYVSKWWPGFSFIQFTLGCFLAAITFYMTVKGKSDKFMLLCKALAPIFVICYLCLWIEFPWGGREATFAAIEEILSPSAGALPSINFTSQYINLLGYPILPFTYFFPEHSVLIAYIYVDILKIATLFFSLSFLKFAIGKKWIPLFILLITALPSISGVGQYYNESNATSYWAVFPLRLVLPLGLGALLMRFMQTPISNKKIFLIGFISAITAVNNTDWGIPAAGGALAVLIFGAESMSEFYRRLQSFFFGIFLFLAFYSILLKLVSGYWPDPISFVYFAKVFINESAISFSMQNWGLHWLVLGTFAMVSSVGIIGYSAFGKSLYGYRSIYFAALIYIGIFSLGASLYFINRALLPVLENLFLQWAICVALITYGAIRFLEHGIKFPKIYPNIIFLTFPAFLLFGVTSLSVLNGPHLHQEWARITNVNTDKTTPSWLLAIESRSILIENKIKLLGSQSRVGLIANNSNLIASRLGIKSLSGFWSPMPIIPMPLAIKSMNDQICLAIQRSNVKYLFVEPRDLYPLSLDMLSKCLDSDAKLILLSAEARYKFLPPNDKETKYIDGFPSLLPIVEVHVKLNNVKNIDSIEVFAPNGLGNWTSLPFKSTWGIGVVDKINNGYKIKNQGKRLNKMNLAHGDDLYFWFPDNGNLSACPELKLQFIFSDGSQESSTAICN